MAALEAQLAPIFSKAPHLPPHVRTTIAEFAPWVALIVGIIGLFGIIPALMATFFVASFPLAPMMGGWYPAAIVSLLCGAISSVLCLFAFRPLGKRQKKGWNLLFYSSTLSALSSIISMIFGYSGFIGIIGAVIGYWLLFEVREMYRS